jgi:predicted transcriptional regulator
MYIFLKTPQTRFRLSWVMRQENDLTYLRRRLKETIGQHNSIAERSGVPQSTISRLHLGATPRLDTAIKLIEVLKKMEQEGK